MKVVDTYLKKEFCSKSLRGAYKKGIKFIFRTYFADHLKGKKVENLKMYIDKEFVGGYKLVIEFGCETDIRETLQNKCLKCQEVNNLPWFEENALQKCNTCKCNSLLSESQRKLDIKKCYLRERVQYLELKAEKAYNTNHE